MFTRHECIAMLLAGGQGSRLGILTAELAKPAVPFGGKYRIIDFTLSNCINSGVETVGVLTQYQPHELTAYIGNGAPWDLDRMRGGVHILPPYLRGKSGHWYKGTANAIHQNVSFIDRYAPEHLLVLSGDHIYKMDYAKLIAHHVSTKAHCTIAVMEVPIAEASRFGIMNTRDDGAIYEFEEKPAAPKSNKASMGVYVFNWESLRSYLEADDDDSASSHDFGKDIIPKMLNAGERMFSYPFHGYWKDVGTIESLWDANMDLLDESVALNLDDPKWRIYSRNPVEPPAFIATEGRVTDSMITEGAVVAGEVFHSVVSPATFIAAGALVEHSVIMPGARVEVGARVSYAILAEEAYAGAGATITGSQTKIAVVGSRRVVGARAAVGEGEQVTRDIEPAAAGGR